MLMWVFARLLTTTHSCIAQNFKGKQLADLAIHNQFANGLFTIIFICCAKKPIGQSFLCQDVFAQQTTKVLCYMVYSLSREVA